MGWAESELTAKLELDGRNITLSWLEHIEAHQLYVRNFELLYYREVFDEALKEFFPSFHLETVPHDIKAANEETTPGVVRTTVPELTGRVMKRRHTKTNGGAEAQFWVATNRMG